MTEFIKNNKFTIHVATEIICMCGIVMFINRNNKSVYEHLKYLEDKLEIHKKKIEEQDNIIEILKRKVIQIDKILSMKTEQRSFPQTPVQQQDIFDIPERIIIEQVLQQQLKKPQKQSVVIEETEPLLPSKVDVQTILPQPEQPDFLVTDTQNDDHSHEEDLDREIEKELSKIKSNNKQ